MASLRRDPQMCHFVAHYMLMPRHCKAQRTVAPANVERCSPRLDRVTRVAQMVKWAAALTSAYCPEAVPKLTNVAVELYGCTAISGCAASRLEQIGPCQVKCHLFCI